mmetsp:Transcript_145914/g.406447  ORF Transcript_145914/g.406447 Transcript_145914/m.406447 type:complete len:383 (-) Transcript_145914:30-1178(-)
MATAPQVPVHRCLVLGAGVQGLTCALRLWEQGWEVTVLARDWLAKTTSHGAGALWEYPPFQVEPQEQARRWVLSSHGLFQAVARMSEAQHPSGVRIRRSYYLYRDPAHAADMRSLVATQAHLNAHEGLPPSGLHRDQTFSYGFSYDAPVICMAQYLPWLANVVGQLPGVCFAQVALRDLAHLQQLKISEGAGLVVNCLGLGARTLFGDSTVYGVRGDLVYVAAPGVEDAYDVAHVSDEDDPTGALTYMVSQGNGIIALAGTAQKVSEGTAEAPAEVLAAIIKRNVDAFPCLGPCPVVVGHWSGLRPQREGGIRLELADEGALGPVVHNYGHGGSGIVTSWGCAADVAALALQAASIAGLALRRRELPSHLAALSAAGATARL